MKKYNLVIKEDVLTDIHQLAADISSVSKSVFIADKYIDGLYLELIKLSIYGNSIAFCTNKSIVQKYGTQIRRVNYKKVAIFYYVDKNDIIVQSIMFQHKITNLE